MNLFQDRARLCQTQIRSTYFCHRTKNDHKPETDFWRGFPSIRESQLRFEKLSGVQIETSVSGFLQSREAEGLN